MNQDTQLEWVQRNRSRKSRVQPLGVWAERVVSQVDADGLTAARSMAHALSPLVDEQFREHCRVARVGRRRVIIHVDDPALVYQMRMRWVPALRSARRIGSLWFEFGTSGVTLPPAGSTVRG